MAYCGTESIGWLGHAMNAWWGTGGYEAFWDSFGRQLAKESNLRQIMFAQTHHGNCFLI